MGWGERGWVRKQETSNNVNYMPVGFAISGGGGAKGDAHCEWLLHSFRFVREWEQIHVGPRTYIPGRAYA